MDRYGKFFARIVEERPDAVFIGGDLLPSRFAALRGENQGYENFTRDFLANELERIKKKLGEAYPKIFLILGNDDGKIEEREILEVQSCGLIEYMHFRQVRWEEFTVFGYSYIPPTPFRLKDWERYDVTRYIRPGCIGPEDKKGVFTTEVKEEEIRTRTIENDLKILSGEENLENQEKTVRPEKSIYLFHSPPHGCNLDRAALDGHRINDIQVDVHVGSSAIYRFITKHQPLLTLHGHIHESTRLTGKWKEQFNRTVSFNASHDGPELSLVRFDPYCIEKAERQLI